MRGTSGLVMVALLLGGCAEGPAEPVPTTIGAVSPSGEAGSSGELSAPPTAEPVPPVPEMPTLAREQTPEGAVAFAEWWFDTLNYATETGDTSGLVAASASDCEACANFRTQIDGAYAVGGRIEGGSVSVSVEAPGDLEVRGINLVVFADVSPMILLDAQSKVVSEFPEGKVVFMFAALSEPEGWSAGAISSEAS